MNYLLHLINYLPCTFIGINKRAAEARLPDVTSEFLFYYHIFLELHSPLTNWSGSITEARQAKLELEWLTRRLIYDWNKNLIQET